MSRRRIASTGVPGRPRVRLCGRRRAMSALTRRKIASSSSSRSSCASSGSKASGSPGTSPNSRTGGWRSMIMAVLPKIRGSRSHHHSRSKSLILHRKLALLWDVLLRRALDRGCGRGGAMRESETSRGWEGALERWLAPVLSAWGREAQRRWAPVYLKGLILPGERKSVEPLAARVAPGGTEQLHHFIGGSPWATGPLEAVLAEEADRLVGGPEAVLVIDDTALPKQGKHSVGVARQYCGCLGKRANCQVLVSLTLARGEVPVPVGLRLFLPDGWTADPGRCARAGVPEEHRRPLAKPEIALEEVDRVVAAGVRFGRVLADAGYGAGAAFRRGLSARGLLWAVGVLKVQTCNYPH